MVQWKQYWFFKVIFFVLRSNQLCRPRGQDPNNVISCNLKSYQFCRTICYFFIIKTIRCRFYTVELMSCYVPCYICICLATPVSVIIFTIGAFRAKQRTTTSLSVKFYRMLNCLKLVRFQHCRLCTEQLGPPLLQASLIEKVPNPCCHF